MPAADLPTIEDVKRLHLNPGDTLVLHLAGDPTAESIEGLAERLRREFPDNRVLVLTEGAKVEVLEAGAA